MHDDLGGGLSTEPPAPAPGGVVLRGLFNSRPCWEATKQELPRTDRHNEFHLHSKQAWAAARPRWQAVTSPCPRLTCSILPRHPAPALPAGSAPGHRCGLPVSPLCSALQGLFGISLWCSLSFATGHRFPVSSLRLLSVRAPPALMELQQILDASTRPLL